MIYARFAGIGCLGSVSFSLRQGVTPSTGSVAFPVQFNPPAFGDLELYDGRGGRVVLREMYLVDPVRSQAEGGDIIQATIADKRLLWQYGWVAGRYNTPHESIGEPYPEKSLEWLIGFALSNYGVSVRFVNIPVAYPTVDWNFTNPATAVQELCNQYGLAVSLDPDGSVWVSPAGEPRFFPGGNFISRELTVVNKPIPSSIIIVGNRIINQRDYSLQPVGVELGGVDPDGTIKAINDLSYKPAAGWGKSILRDFTDVLDEFGDEEYKLAQKCIFKWYGWIPTDVGYDSRQYCLPWLGHIKDLIEVPNSILANTKERGVPVVGVAEIEGDGISYINGALAKTKRSFSLDYTRGIVKFAEPVVNIVAAGAQLIRAECTAAQVVITAAHEDCRGDGDTSVSPLQDHYYYVYPLGGILAPYVRTDPSLTLYSDTDVIDSVQFASLNAFTGQTAAKIATQFEYINPMQYVYAGLLSIPVYGAFKSVTWNAGEDGANTVVSLGVEEIRPFLPSYNERMTAKKTVALEWPTGLAISRRRASLEQTRKAVGTL